MTAMRLHRYPSSSGGIALGKMGVGATMLRPILPAGARWVAYLESTGTQRIDTGITPSAATECNIDLMFTGTTTQQFGTGRSSGTRWAVLLGFNNNRIAFWAGVPQNERRSTYTINERVMCGFSILDGTYWLGGEPTADANLTAPTTDCPTFALFARKNTTNSFSNFCTMRIFSAKINGVEGIRDFRPIAIGNTGYMLDLVRGEYLPYGNAGTGAFVIGPDTNAPAI